MNMKRIAIAIVLMLFVVVVAHAQTCTPIKLSKSWTNKDDGTNPYYDFWINGTKYAQESTITLPAVNSFNEQVAFHGYVDVFALYGGCTQSWNLNGFNYYFGLYDLTLGRFVDDTPQQDFIENIYCGKVPACAFSNGTSLYTMIVVPGHRYHLWAYVSMGTSVGTSAWFSDYITINVQ